MSESNLNPGAAPDRAGAVPDSEIRRSPVISVETASWTGPLPTPADFHRYDATLPGAANRILQLAERQQSHRHNMEAGALEIARTTIVSDSRRGYLGIILGFVIAMIGLLGGIFLVALGRGGFGLTLGLASLAGLVAVFVYGAQSRRAERRRNAESAGAE